MKKQFLLILVLLTLGCSQNHFNVPAENFSDKVKVLGIAPIMIDTDSDIKYPQRELLISMVTDMNRKYEQQLIHKLKGTGSFYTVTLLDSEPQQNFGNLLFRREKRDDATIQYNKHFWKNEVLRNYIRSNNLDAVMLIVVSGLSKTDKISSSTLLASLTGEYNYLIMTAQILDSDGTILWEYPNFRRRILSYTPIINLQYPDFSEAEANLSAKTDIRFKTLEGLRRLFEQKQKDLLLRETPESKLYSTQFNEMASLLRHDHDKKQKDHISPNKPKTSFEQQTTAIDRPVQPAPFAEPFSEPTNIPTIAKQSPTTEPARPADILKTSPVEITPRKIGAPPDN